MMSHASVPDAVMPPRLDDVARLQIKDWLRASRITQVAFGEQIGRSQDWVSKYLGGYYDADLSTLQQMAAIFGHSFTRLFAELPAMEDEEETAFLIDVRRWPPTLRKALYALVREWGVRLDATARKPKPRQR